MARALPLLLSGIFTAIALGAALAHLLEFRVKMDLGREDYLTVQQIYAGWQFLGIAVILQLVFLSWGCWSFREAGGVLMTLLAALAALLASQIIFWVATYPVNVATRNWTRASDAWQALRVQWEYSHLAGSVCQFIVMLCVLLAALQSGRETG